MVLLSLIKYGTLTPRGTAPAALNIPISNGVLLSGYFSGVCDLWDSLHTGESCCKLYSVESNKVCDVVFPLLRTYNMC